MSDHRLRRALAKGTDKKADCVTHGRQKIDRKVE